MSRLDASLDDWIAAGLITGEQATAIRAFEAARPRGNWLFYGFLGLAGGVIGLGVIALVAANWAEIPDAVKLGGDFLLLLLLALAAGRWLPTPRTALAELTLFLFTLLVMASIGLISQIYHTSGEFYQATLFWSVITLPAATLSRRGVLTEFWVTVALWSLVWFIVDNPWGPFFDAHPERWLATLFALPLACGLLAHGLRNMAGAEGFVSGFRGWVWLGGLLAAFSIDLSAWEHHRTMPPLVLLPGLFLALLLAAGLWTLPLPPLRQRLLTLILGLYVLLHMVVVLTPVGVWGSALMVIALLAAAALDAAARGDRRTANILLMLMAGRFVMLYLDAMGGLAATGVGLILTGLVILGLLHLWRRHQATLFRWVAERMP